MSFIEFFKNNKWILKVVKFIMSRVLNKKDKGIEVKQVGTGSQVQMTREGGMPININIGDVGAGASVIINVIPPYLDGLPDTTGKKRELFEKGQEQEKKFLWTEAISSYREFLTLKPESSERIAILMLIGNCFSFQGQFEVALENYYEAMDLSKKSGNQKGLAGVLNNIGQLYINKKDFKSAQEYLQEAYEIYQVIAPRSYGMAYSLNNIGLIYIYKGDFKNALKYFKEGYEIHQDISPRSQETSTFLHNIGSAYLGQGNLIKALEYLQKSLNLDEDLAPRSIKTANRLNNIAGIYLSQGNSIKSLKNLQKALDIYTAVGSKSQIAIVKGNIEEVKKKRNK